MIFKIAFRNSLRSAERYFVFFCTMAMTAGLLFAFNSMIFSEDIKAICGQASMMAVILLIATCFILMVIAWLINYMMRFMLERKSREFAIYMLLGIKRKKIARIYFLENFGLGSIAFIAGLFIGIPMQQLLMVMFYQVMGIPYRINIEIDAACMMFSLACYCLCFFFAMFRGQRKLKKITINSLIHLEKENEEIEERHIKSRKSLFFLSILYIVGFQIYLFSGAVELLPLFGAILGLGISLYLIYIGLSAYLFDYVKKRRAGIYSGTNLFLLRQLAAKIKTMCFTMGTITVLFVTSLIGASSAFLLNDFQSGQLETAFPFDISIHRSSADYNFDKEKGLIDREAGIKDAYDYTIYQAGTKQISDYFYQHLSFFNGRYAEADDIQGDAYYPYDLFIRLSDYNRLREMLNYDPVFLGSTEYLIQTKERLQEEILTICDQVLELDPVELFYGGCETIPFCQNGHNGADFLIVVPDIYTKDMTPYYSQMAVRTKLAADDELWQELAEMNPDKIEAVGTDIIMYSDNTLVKNLAIRDMKFVLVFLIFPLFYIGIIFLIVAVTVLAVQQLSDSAKHRGRYSVLQKLGLNRRELCAVIRRQLRYVYLCPAVAAGLVSSFVIYCISSRFVTYTGMQTVVWSYWIQCLGAFFLIDFGYYLITYLEFKHNIFCGR